MQPGEKLSRIKNSETAAAVAGAPPAVMALHLAVVLALLAVITDLTAVVLNLGEAHQPSHHLWCSQKPMLSS